MCVLHQLDYTSVVLCQNTKWKQVTDRDSWLIWYTFQAQPVRLLFITDLICPFCHFALTVGTQVRSPLAQSFPGSAFTLHRLSLLRRLVDVLNFPFPFSIRDQETKYLSTNRICKYSSYRM